MDKEKLGKPIDPLNVPEDNLEVDRYYQEKLKQIQSLFSQPETKQQALDLLNEELDQPYTPLKYFEQFSELAAEYNAEVKISRLKDWTLEQLLTSVVQNGNFEPELFEHLMNENPDKMRENQNLALMQIYLSGSDDNVNKIFAIDVMGQHAIDYEFNFVNTRTKETAVLNPLLFTSEFQTKEQNAAILKVNDLTFQDPSLNRFAIDLLLQSFIYFYPATPVVDPEELATAVVNRVQGMLGLDNWKSLDTPGGHLVDEVLEHLSQENTKETTKN